MKRKYLSPSVEVIKVAIEKGFATSPQVNDYAQEGEAGMLNEGETFNW